MERSRHSNAVIHSGNVEGVLVRGRIIADPAFGILSYPATSRFRPRIPLPRLELIQYGINQERSRPRGNTA